MHPTDPPALEPDRPDAAARSVDPSMPVAPNGLEVPPTAVVPARGASSSHGPILALAMIVVSVLAGGALFVSGFLVGQRASAQPGTPVAVEQDFQAFWDSYDTITSRYAGGAVDRNALVNGAIKGMVDSLGDPYSAYLTPDQYRQGLQDLSGQFEGIGAEIGTKNAKGDTTDCTTLGPDCLLVVVSPIEASPSEKAGIKAGDAIVAVDGVALDGLTVDGARDKIRGEKGTEVVLSVVRGSAKAVDITVTRDVIVSKEVVTKDLASGAVGYIAVTGFSDNAATKFHDALQADLKAGKTRIILDLRGNPGGYVTAARAIASEFIKSGPVFLEEDAAGTQTPTDASGQGIATDSSVKLVVLVDKGSASASEIVAGALQDRKRATIVGETSFGKGTVQQWIQLQDGAALKLTIAKWLTPDKRWIHHVGIVPDVPVATRADAGPDNDPALDKAVELLTKESAAIVGTLRPAA
ncbi:MAG: carboxyl-terminal processing protease [Chloroflexota bacterium]|jgi:carboxyl-terminal processing protease|nr:carboxyl-terminal processing protease [Chloroflexota bacterium]